MMKSTADRIYLDNAATSWPKPVEVYDAIDHYQRNIGVTSGRGNYRLADDVSRIIQQTRTNIAKLIGAAAGGHVIFAYNCTDALNLVLHGLLQQDDHVITSVAEHNSILRPLAFLTTSRGVEMTMVDVDAHGRIALDQVGQAIRPNTKLIAVTHASNVTGALQPVADIGRIAKDHECLLLVDAAQTIGHVPVDVTTWGADFLAAPGHKGLLGPLGTGVLYIAPGVEQSLASVRQGGTGTQSEMSLQPNELPAKYESGNLNVLGLMGLDAGVRYVLDHQLDLSKDVSALRRRLIDQLDDVPRVRLFGVHSGFDTVGIVSFTVDGYDPLEVASMLDTAGNMQVRAGLHCAPEMHRALGTLASGGTVRISCGHFNTVEEIDRVANLVQTMASPVTYEGS